MSSGWIPCVRTTRQSCSLFCVKPKTEPGTGPRAGRPREASTHTRFYVCVCVFVSVSAVLDPQDTHPPISQNSTEDVMLREQWNPATNALACEISEGMWGTAVWSDNVLLKIPKHSLEASCLAGRGSADCEKKSLSCVQSPPNQYCCSNFSFDMCTFGGSVFCSTMWVAHKPKGNRWL